MRYIKNCLKFLLFTLIFVIFIWLSLILIIQNDKSRGWLIQKSQALVEFYTGLNIEFSSLNFIFPLGIEIEGLKVSQKGQLILAVDSLTEFCLSPKLFEGKIVCSSFKAKHIEIFSFGVSSSSPNKAVNEHPSLEGRQFYLPNYLKFEDLNLQDIQFHQSVFANLDLPKEIKETLSLLSFNLEGKISTSFWTSSLNSQLLLTGKHLEKKINLLELSLLSDKQGFLMRGEFLLSFPSYFPWESFVKVTAKSDPDFLFQLIQGDVQELSGDIKVTIPDRELLFYSEYNLLSKNELLFPNALLIDPYSQVMGSLEITPKGITKGTFEGEVGIFKHPFQFLSTISGNWDTLRAKIEMTHDNINYQGYEIQDFNLEINGQRKDDEINGIVEMKFGKNGVPFQIFSHWKIGHHFEQLDFKNLNISFLNSHLDGELNVDLENHDIHGEITGKEIDLAFWKPLIGQEVFGKAKMDLMLFSSLEKGSLERMLKAQVWVENFSLQEFKAESFNLNSELNLDELLLKATVKLQQVESNGLSLNEANIDFYAEDLVKEPFGELTYQLKELSLKQFFAREISGDAQFDSSSRAWPFSLVGEGEWLYPWMMENRGNWYLNFTPHSTNFELNVKESFGKLKGEDFSLREVLKIKKNEDKLLIELSNLMFEKSEIAASLINEKESMELDFKAGHIPTYLFEPFLPDLPLKGEISINGHLEGDLQHPTGEVTIDIGHLQLQGEYLTRKSSFSGKVHLDLSKENVELQSQFFGIGKQPLVIQGKIPYFFSLWPFRLEKKDALSWTLEVKGEGEIDAYLPLLVPDAPSLAGEMKLDLKIDGRGDEFSVQGNLNLEDGMYEDIETGDVYDHITAEFIGEGEKLLLKRFSAKDNHGGNVQATGQIFLKKAESFPFDIAMTATGIYLMHSDYASISASGSLSLMGNMKHSKLKGNLKTKEAIVKIGESLPKQIKIIDFTYINIPEEKALDFKDIPKKSRIELDVKLNAEEVLIQGNGLKSNWKGEIVVSGTTKQPLLFGDLHVSKGQYDLKGKTFNLSQGSLHFAGAAEKKTTVYLVASKEIEQLRVEIIVKGPLDKLAFSLRSNPPLSQREILSYILFNKGIADITSGEGDTLYQSFTSLNSAGQTEETQDLLTRLRNNTGIDRLDFTSSGEGENKELALQVGKYLWDGVFVSLNKSMAAAPGRILIEVDVIKNVKGQAKVDIGGNNSQSEISLQWKKDY